MQEGDWRVFAGAVKYFRHVLKSNEIFLKIFNGPQDIFLFSFIVLIFSSFIWKVNMVWAQNIETDHQGEK